MTGIHFHQNTFTSKPFASIEHERDWLEQALPPAFVLLQPELGENATSAPWMMGYVIVDLGSREGIPPLDTGVRVRRAEAELHRDRDSRSGWRRPGDLPTRRRRDDRHSRQASCWRGWQTWIRPQGISRGQRNTAASGTVRWLPNLISAIVTVPRPNSVPDTSTTRLGLQPTCASLSQHQLHTLHFRRGSSDTNPKSCGMSSGLGDSSKLEDSSPFLLPWLHLITDYGLTSFCTHPTMPIATGRFGPRQQKYWRY